MTRPQFPTTHWSLVRRAGLDETPERDALSELLEQYLPALRAYLTVTRRLTVEEAEDALQDFLLEKVLRERLIRHADERRGKFRTFLLVVLNRYLISRRRRRDRPGQALSLEGLDSSTLADDVTPPSLAFDVEWGRAVLRQAQDATEAECQAQGRMDVWQLLQARVIRPSLEGSPPPGYDVLVSQLALKSPTQAANLLVTGKRMFERNLRTVVGAYASDESEVEMELAELARVLSDGRAG